MSVTKEKLTEILKAEKELKLKEWEQYFDGLTEEEQQAYFEADSGQER